MTKKMKSFLLSKYYADPIDTYNASSRETRRSNQYAYVLYVVQ